MATVTLGSTPTTIDLAESVTNWGGDTFSLEPDIKVQGSNSVACVQTVNGNNDAYVTGTWDFSGTGVGEQHLRLWFNITYIGNLAATNAIQVFLYDGTNTAYYYWDKWADYTGGWAQAIIYTGDTADSGTVTKSSVTRIGMRFVTSTKPRNVPANAWFDAWRYGDGYYATGGTSGDEIDLDLIAVDDLTNAYGVVTKEVNGSVSLRGDLQIGNGATTTWFKMDNQEAFFVEEQVNTGLYKFHGNGAGCRIDVVDATLKSAGTAAKDKFDFDMSEANLLTCSVVDTKLTNGDEVTYKSGQTATGNIYNGCGQITHAGADKDDIVVKGYEGTANTSALIYDVNADPDGELDRAEFVKGTAATHAIEFGTNVPATMTLRDVTCTGYNAADTQNDSTFHFKDTAGTITLNLIGFTGNSSYRSDGATIDIVIDPVTELVNVKNAAGTNLQNVRVIVETAATIASGEIFEAAVTSLTQSAGTATCTTTAVHGLTTNDYVVIRGAQPDGYNKVAQVTVSSTTVFTYSVDSGLSSPATGTPVVSFVAVYGLTDASGNVSSTRTWGANQQLKGWARNTVAGSPYLKQGDIAYTVDSTNGNTTNVVLQPDE